MMPEAAGCLPTPVSTTKRTKDSKDLGKGIPCLAFVIFVSVVVNLWR